MRFDHPQFPLKRMKRAYNGYKSTYLRRMEVVVPDFHFDHLVLATEEHFHLNQALEGQMSLLNPLR